MAHSKEHQDATYPLMAYNFRVTIDGTSMSFSEVSGLNREHKTLTYRHGFSQWEGEDIVKFRYDTWVSITMKRGMVKGVTALSDWLEKKDRSTIEIALCDASGTPVLGWHIAKAIPVKLDAPAFDARSGDVAIDSLEIKASGITIKDLT